MFRDLLKRRQRREVIEVFSFIEVVLEASTAGSLRQGSLQMTKTRIGLASSSWCTWWSELLQDTTENLLRLVLTSTQQVDTYKQVNY